MCWVLGVCEINNVNFPWSNLLLSDPYNARHEHKCTFFFRERRMTTREWETAKIRNDWAENPRWKGIKRGYSAEDVYRLRGSVQIEHTLARRGAEKLWKMC